MKHGDWTVTQTDPRAFRIEYNIEKSGQPVRLLLMSDEHFDNRLCDRGLVLKHHQEAAEWNAPIVKAGDTFCAMQGKWDKRADQDQLRPELRGNNYLDKLVQCGGDLYGPYAKQIALVGEGNHESKIEEHHQTNLIQRLVERLRAQNPLCRALAAPYCFYVRLSLRYGGRAATTVLRCHHGYGGGGEVTRGMIDNSRTRSQALADIYFSGHIHRSNDDANVIERLSSAGTVETSEQMFLRGASYKGIGRWEESKGFGQRPLGGWWLEMRVLSHRKGVSMDVVAIRAK